LINPVEAVAFSIHRALYGGGTDDESLIATTILFSDFFRGPMIQVAFAKFGDITKSIKSDLSGKYEDAILGLWGLQ
jgi:hypothetical protein